MKKLELINVISEVAEISKVDAKKSLEATLDAIIVTLKEGEEVTLQGFGTFRAKQRSARTGRNPRTGESVQISSS